MYKTLSNTNIKNWHSAAAPPPDCTHKHGMLPNKSMCTCVKDQVTSPGYQEYCCSNASSPIHISDKPITTCEPRPTFARPSSQYNDAQHLMGWPHPTKPPTPVWSRPAPPVWSRPAPPVWSRPARPSIPPHPTKPPTPTIPPRPSSPEELCENDAKICTTIGEVGDDSNAEFVVCYYPQHKRLCKPEKKICVPVGQNDGSNELMACYPIE